MNKIKKTSEEWQNLRPNVEVIDPDGWDRHGDFNYSWYVEKITKEEYNSRVMVSTCMMKEESNERQN